MKPNNDTPAARGKWQKSLIVYYDTMGGILDELDDEQAGQLFKALFYYGWQTYGGGGDRHEVLDRLLPDFNMRALFAALKTQVDRDGEKWRRTVEKRAQAGRKGENVRHPRAFAGQCRANAGKRGLYRYSNGYSYGYSYGYGNGYVQRIHWRG